MKQYNIVFLQTIKSKNKGYEELFRNCINYSCLAHIIYIYTIINFCLVIYLSSVPFWVVEMMLPLLSFVHFLIPSTFPHDDQHISRKENLCVRIICIHILENSEILKNQFLLLDGGFLKTMHFRFLKTITN